MFIFKICVWIKSGNIFLAHPVYAVQSCIKWSVFTLKRRFANKQVFTLKA